MITRDIATLNVSCSTWMKYCSEQARGRVQDLLLRQETEQRRGSEDLLNRAAIATLLQKGQVFELRASEMPEPVDVAAVLRF